MAEYTTRISLRKPQYTDVRRLTDDVKTNFQTIDDNLNFGQCLSSARPINPYDGMLRRETDTDNLIVYDAATVKWIVIGNNKFAKGKKGTATDLTDSSNFTTGNFGILPFTFTAEAGRKYFVEVAFYMACSLAATNPTPIVCSLRWAAGATVAFADAQVGSNWTANIRQAADADNFYKIVEFFPNVSAQVTIGLFVSRAAGAGTFNRRGSSSVRNTLRVRDWGI